MTMLVDAQGYLDIPVDCPVHERTFINVGLVGVVAELGWEAEEEIVGPLSGAVFVFVGDHM